MKGARAHGARARVHFMDDILRPVDVEVEPEAEKVLMVWGDNVGGDEVTGRPVRLYGHSRSVSLHALRQHDAGERRVDFAGMLSWWRTQLTA